MTIPHNYVDHTILHRNPCYPDAIAKQSGAVLMISLVVLVVLTVISLSALDSSVLEEKMSANSMNKQITFQAVESVVNDAIRDTDILSSAITSGNSVQHTVTMTNTAIVASADITYQGEGIPVGFSLGQNGGSYVAYKFDATGTATIAASAAQTATSQGVSVVGPKM
jgi:type IV pilus assembly protein PilX